jgi:hypothetical protein
VKTPTITTFNSPAAPPGFFLWRVVILRRLRDAGGESIAPALGRTDPR